ncbi:Glycerol kinase 5 [Paragonimus heterotremus]|uniref:Glycerol kinase 5 n=1 Tax=Paragonimus heterotremus TaxID=100268 RepID=A0A8J4SZ52_9TREM|nr:Glycerol kinase 5 [Paragonimus heterotremus]
MEAQQFILGVDFGSTHACARLYSYNLETIGSSSHRIDRLEDSDGSCELDPEGVWITFCRTISGVLTATHVRAEQVRCVGISVQRNSLLLWDRETSKPRSNVITWQDLRASDLTKKWNNSLILRSMKAGGHVLYWMTRMPRFKALASYRFKTTLACIRLKLLLDERPMLLADCRRGSVCYGCLETWFLWKLTGGESFYTDVSCASVSGFYDPFARRWSGPILASLGIPHEILPEVRPSSHFFGYIRHGPLKLSNSTNLIPVTALIGDAQAATLAENCLSLGQAKLTLGTGSFLNLSTGSSARALMNGLYPVIGWASNYVSGDPLSGYDLRPIDTYGSSVCGSNSTSRPSDLTYLLEGSHPNTGTIIEWLRNERLFNTYTELEEMLRQGDEMGLDEIALKNGAFYVTVPPNLLRTHQLLFSQNVNTRQHKLMGPDGILVGITDKTTQLERMLTVRIVMESIAFTVRQMLTQCRREAGLSPTELRVNGNVSRSDWLMQRLADVTGIPTERSAFEESSCLGSAIAAGVGSGIWPNYSAATRMLHDHQERLSIRRLSSETSYKLSRRFQPAADMEHKMHMRLRAWCRARAAYARKLCLTKFTHLKQASPNRTHENRPCLSAIFKSVVVR